MHEYYSRSITGILSYGSHSAFSYCHISLSNFAGTLEEKIKHILRQDPEPQLLFYFHHEEGEEGNQSY